MQDSPVLGGARWEVFRGDSTSRRNLLFTVVKPSSFQIRTKIYIFLAGNASEEAPDFVIQGSYHDGACTVSPGNSDATIAQASVIFQLQNHAMFHAIFIRFGIELIMQMDGLHTIPYHMKWAPMPLPTTNCSLMAVFFYPQPMRGPMQHGFSAGGRCPCLPLISRSMVVQITHVCNCSVSGGTSTLQGSTQA